MNKKELKECLKFIEDNRFIYLDFLSKQIHGFPFICDFSSEILAAYLLENFKLNVEVVEGYFDDNEDMVHYWIEIEGYSGKIDFTLCQFDEDYQDFMYKNMRKSFKGEDVDEILKGVDVYNDVIKDKIPFPFVENESSWNDRFNYLDSRNYVWGNIAREAQKSKGCFKTYLNNVAKYYNN